MVMNRFLPVYTRYNRFIPLQPLYTRYNRFIPVAAVLYPSQLFYTG